MDLEFILGTLKVRLVDYTHLDRKQGITHTHTHTHKFSSKCTANPIQKCMLLGGVKQPEKQEAHTDTRRTSRSCMLTC